MEKLRKEGKPLLIVDSGDLFFDGKEAADLQRALAKARVLGRAYRHMGVAAVNVGDLDLSRGVDFLKAEAAQGLPLISANLMDESTGSPAFPASMIKEIAGLRIGLFGLLTPQLGPEARKAAAGAVWVKDPVAVAREMVKGLGPQVDLIVLLSDLGFGKEADLAKAVPGIHFILGAHEGATRSHEEAGTHILQAYRKGMVAGVLRMSAETKGAPFRDEGRPEELQRRISSLDTRLRSLEEAKERQPHAAVERSIQQLTQQRTALEGELNRLKGNPSPGNRFRWSAEQLSTDMPESEEVRGWLREAGIDQD